MVVDQPRVLLEHLVVARAHRVLELGDGVGVVHVMLAAAAPLVLPAGLKLMVEVGHDPEGAPMAIGGLARDRLEAHSAHARRGPGEVAIDHLLVKPDSLENLRPAIALHGRDAHLGGDLDEALHHRLVEVLDRALLVDVL